MKNNLGFIIGRFQPFHKGHLNLLNIALDLNDKVIVFIGSSSEKRTEKNPFTYSERKEIISRSVPQASLDKILFIPLPDFQKDSDWVEHVLNCLESYKAFSHYFFCFDKDLLTQKSNKLFQYTKSITSLVKNKENDVIYHATDIREALKNNTSLEDLGIIPKSKTFLVSLYYKIGSSNIRKRPCFPLTS